MMFKKNAYDTIVQSFYDGLSDWIPENQMLHKIQNKYIYKQKYDEEKNRVD